MSNNKALQILRGSSSYDPNTRTEELLDGQLFYSKKNKQLYIGDDHNYKDDNNKLKIEATSPIGAANLTPGTGKYSIKSLSASEASGENSIALGVGTKATKDNQIVLGSYNNISDDALFILGDGSADNSRSNRIVINNDKNYIYKETHVQGELILNGESKFYNNVVIDKKDGNDEVPTIRINSDKLTINNNVTKLNGDKLIIDNTNNTIKLNNDKLIINNDTIKLNNDKLIINNDTIKLNSPNIHFNYVYTAVEQKGIRIDTNGDILNAIGGLNILASEEKIKAKNGFTSDGNLFVKFNSNSFHINMSGSPTNPPSVLYFGFNKSDGRKMSGIVIGNNSGSTDSRMTGDTLGNLSCNNISMWGKLTYARNQENAGVINCRKITIDEDLSVSSYANTEINGNVTIKNANITGTAIITNATTDTIVINKLILKNATTGKSSELTVEELEVLKELAKAS